MLSYSFCGDGALCPLPSNFIQKRREIPSFLSVHISTKSIEKYLLSQISQFCRLISFSKTFGLLRSNCLSAVSKNSVFEDTHSGDRFRKFPFCVIFVRRGTRITLLQKRKFFSPFSCKNSLLRTGP